MDIIKMDRRVRKTKGVLLQSLIKLMSEKRINKITVKELTELADVNRSTFYLYYQDLFDMLEKVEMELFNDFKKNYEIFLNESKSYGTILNFFEYAFHFAENNAELFKILLGPYGDYSFVEKFKDAIINANPSMEIEKNNLEKLFTRSFIVAGFVGVIQKWLESQKEFSAKEMSETMMRLIYKDLENNDIVENILPW